MGAFSRLVRRDDGVLSLPVRRDARCREHGVVTAHKQALAAEQTNSLGHDNDVNAGMGWSCAVREVLRTSSVCRT